MHRNLVVSLVVLSLAGACRREPASTRPTSGPEPGSRGGGGSREDGGSRGDGGSREAEREAPAPVKRGDPEAGRLAGITAAHDRVRATVGVGPLEWSPELARFAQRWADKLQKKGCDLQHRPRSGPDAQKYGENIFSATGQSPTAAEVVDTWAEELADYDAKRNKCKGVCGHYTQIVWRASLRVGCAMATCGDTEVWVCNYDPPGNFLGQRPY